MIKLLLFLGIILSIVKANGWFIVPMPVLVFCWVMSFVCWLIYSYALGVGEGAAKEMRKSTARRADSMSEWISVKERMPEPEFRGQQRGFYLVALSNGVVKELAYEFYAYEDMMFDVGWHETAYPVTHWMPLPESPKEGCDTNGEAKKYTAEEIKELAKKAFEA